MKNKAVAKYIKILKELFLNLNYMEGKFLKDFRSNLIEYTIRHPGCSYEELVSEFGRPEEVLCDYISAQDSDYLLACINKKHLRRWVIGGVVFVGVCCVFIWGVFYYNLYNRSSDSIIETETVEIETIEEE